MLLKDLKPLKLIKHGKVYLIVGEKEFLLNALPRATRKSVIKKYENAYVCNYKHATKTLNEMYDIYMQIYCIEIKESEEQINER